MRNRRSLNINDYWRWYHMHKPAGKEYVLTEKQHNDIIRAVFNAVKKHLLKGEEVYFGNRLGSFRMYKYTYDDRFYIDKNGKVYDNRPIDWDIVNKKKRGELPADTYTRWTKPIAIVVWNRAKAFLKNRIFLKFHVNKGFKKEITEYFKYHEMDLPVLEKHKKNDYVSRIWRAV